MPLQYDDRPGSWGTYSRDWPKATFRSKSALDRAVIACTKGQVVPHGSYVVMDLELRVETEEMLQHLMDYLESSPHHDYESLRDHYVSTGQWGN